MTEYIATLGFSDRNVAYRVLSDLQSSPIGNVVIAAALVEKDDQGHISIPQGGDSSAGAGTATGGVVGALVGILGGPLGVLLGWGTGALIGAASDAGNADDKEDVVELISRSIAPGTNAIVLQTEESDTSDLDGFAARNGAIIARHEVAEVEAEIEAEAQAVKDAQKAAREQLKAQKKAAREAKHAAKNEG